MKNVKITPVAPTVAQRSTVLAIASLLAMSLVTTSALAQSKPADAKSGAAPVAMCIGCHGIEGYKASFPTVYLVPKIAGQSQKYLENALQAYRKGERSHPTMRAIAGSLTDADISALAVYYAQGGSSAVVAGK
jgi:cytochrome c553